MTLVLRIMAGLALLTLAACSGGESGPLPLDVQQSVAFRDSGPPTITVITMVNNRSGSGGHSALMVSGSQRVIFDPAGSYRPDYVTVYGDVIYGMSDRQVQAYLSAHSRNSHHVVSQHIPVSAAVAEQALALVEAQGRVTSAFCTNSTTNILAQLPGFQDTRVTFFPIKLMEQIAQRPDVQTERLFENDEGDVLDGIPEIAPAAD